MNILKRLLCYLGVHPSVHVIRYHATCVPEAWKPKLLYVDRLKVHNFIQCTHCSKILKTNQREKLFEQEKN